MASAVDNAVRVVFEAEWSKLQTAVTGITAKITGIGAAGDKADKKLTMKDAKKGVQSLGDEGKKAGITLRDGFSIAEFGAQKLESRINNLMKALMVGYIANQIKNMGASIGRWFGDSISLFASFEDAMKQVQATMGLTGAAGESAYNRLSAAAEDAGQNTRYTAKEAAEALNYLALAGYDVDQSIGALPGVLKLAQAGGIDLAYASDLVTDSMAALGLQMSDMDGFMDKMAKTSQKSNTSVAQLGEAILTVGGTAKVLAGGTTEMNAALGVLADVGTKGSAGGTALRNIILSLAAPTSEAAKMIQQLGIKTMDAQGNLRPLNDIMGEMSKALDGLGTGQKTQILNRIFNARDIKSVEGLLAATNGRFDELADLIDNSSGAMQNMAETMESGLAGSLRSLSSAYEGLKLSVGNIFSDMAQDAVNKTTELVRSITDKLKSGSAGAALSAIADRLKAALNSAFATVERFAASGGLDRILASLGNMGMALVELFEKALQKLPDALNKLAKAIEWVSNNFAGLIGVVKIAIETWLIFKGVMMAVTIATNPIAAAIGVVIAAIVHLYTTSEKARRIINFAFESIKLVILSVIWAAVANIYVFLDVLDALIGRIPVIGDVVKTVADGVGAILDGLNKEIKNTAGNIKNLVNDTKAATAAISGFSGANKSQADVLTAMAKQAIADAGGNSGNAQHEFSISEYYTGNSLAGDYSGSSGTTDPRTPFEIAMDTISSAFATREDLIDSQIALAEAQGDKTARKSALETYIDTLGDKLKQITGLNRLAANSDELNILETTKNRILTEIVRITEDMNDSLTQLVGSFNVPSEFAALNEYEYITSDNTTTTRVLNTPHVEMYMNFDKLDAKSGEEARQMTDDFLAALFNNGEMAKYMMGQIER